MGVSVAQRPSQSPPSNRPRRRPRIFDGLQLSDLLPTVPLSSSVGRLRKQRLTGENENDDDWRAAYP
jgi:hypothetical protein